MSTLLRSKYLPLSDGVAHQTSLRSHRDHDDCANSLAGGGLSTHFAGYALRPTTSPHRHARIQASPCPRWRQCATAELLVVDLIAQHDPQSDAQLACDGDTGLADPFCPASVDRIAPGRGPVERHAPRLRTAGIVPTGCPCFLRWPSRWRSRSSTRGDQPDVLATPLRPRNGAGRRQRLRSRAR